MPFIIEVPSARLLKGSHYSVPCVALSAAPVSFLKPASAGAASSDAWPLSLKYRVLPISALTVMLGQGTRATWELCGDADAQVLLETP
ncbi:unnamed protein product [Rangifer tarandus platyrhynchus]|uniref:Uncharacterized protein n=1 Tax=Rangifer tarandus platyrhynchus TaxID=3082113 RepID=A0AC59ZGD8_RANTA